jgi:hypothetical protein
VKNRIAQCIGAFPETPPTWGGPWTIRREHFYVRLVTAAAGGIADFEIVPARRIYLQKPRL